MDVYASKKSHGFPCKLCRLYLEKWLSYCSRYERGRTSSIHLSYSIFKLLYSPNLLLFKVRKFGQKLSKRIYQNPVSKDDTGLCGGRGGLKPLKKEFLNGPLHMANSVEGGRNVCLMAQNAQHLLFPSN